MNKFGQPIWAINVTTQHTNKTCKSRGDNGATKVQRKKWDARHFCQKTSTDHSRKATMQQLHVCEAENYDFYARSR